LEEAGYELADNGEEVMVKKKSVKKVTKKGVKKGDGYKCSVCGLAVTVDEVCGCVDACDIICCEKPMKPKKRV
jgi:ribosomal protein S3AE